MHLGRWRSCRRWRSIEKLESRGEMEVFGEVEVLGEVNVYGRCRSLERLITVSMVKWRSSRVDVIGENEGHWRGGDPWKDEIHGIEGVFDISSNKDFYFYL